MPPTVDVETVPSLFIISLVLNLEYVFSLPTQSEFPTKNPFTVVFFALSLLLSIAPPSLNCKSNLIE